MAIITVTNYDRSDGYVTIKIEATSPFSKRQCVHYVRVTEESLSDYLSNNGLIQDCFPELTADERELFITGIYPGELGEEVFGYSCAECGTRNAALIESISTLIECKGCMGNSTPFATA